MSKPITLKNARLASLRGETDVALVALREFCQDGDDAACASLVDLLAFRGEWDECILGAGKFIANPKAVYAGNIFDDMVRVLGRAGHETRRWESIKEACIAAIGSIQRGDYQPWARERYTKILNNLISYAQRDGGPPHELIKVFGVETLLDSLRPEQLKLSYEQAVANAETIRPDLRGHPDRLVIHQFALAAMYSQESEAIALYEGSKDLLSFDDAVYVAKALVAMGESDRAWRTLKQKVPEWWPVDIAQVAPVVLVIDERIRTIMDKDRCKEVLATARGPGAKHVTGNPA